MQGEFYRDAGGVSFHPLKAGRRRRIIPTHQCACSEFPSPQGGSETRKFFALSIADRNVSIPSRRVGDDTAAPFGGQPSLCFHPLKAGRRRPVSTYERLLISSVSIPSRRVGDNLWGMGIKGKVYVSIPSRRVGDKTARHSGVGASSTVSIPSRRVGDRDLGIAPLLLSDRFHPLKAGRRQIRDLNVKIDLSGFHPLKACRILINRNICRAQKTCFHPLKAGRRPTRTIPQRSPCPVSIPSRRVGD